MILKCLFNVLGKQTLIYVADTQAERNQTKDKMSLYKIKVLMLVQIRESLSPWHSMSSGMQMEERPPIWRVAANTLNKQSRTADKGWSARLGAERVANNSSLQKLGLL
jgi:hypothetical protein